MSNLLFTAHGTSGVIKKRRDGEYTIKLRNVSDRITWFTDRPERRAGSGNFKSFISSWDSEYFSDGIKPNAAIEFTDKKGEPDVIVFEMNKPKYSRKRDTLNFRAVINEGQELDGPLESQFAQADSKFTNKFTDASLFIDDAFEKQILNKNVIVNTSDSKVKVPKKRGRKPKNVTFHTFWVGSNHNP